MPAIAVVGGLWGDEGKGKVIDLLAEKAKYVVRYGGGNNAGHTVMNQYGKFSLHLVPAGIFQPHATCVIGNGVVVDPNVLLQEMDMLGKAKIDTSRLMVSSRAHVIMPYHILLDGLEEERRGNSAIGTTRMGVGPAYVDKVARMGIRVGDLTDRKALPARLRPILEYKNAILTKVYGKLPVSPEEIYEKCCLYGERLAPYIRDTEQVLYDALERDDLVLLEGAQGTLLDLDYGTYPFVTSSHPVAGGAAVGAGVSPGRISQVIGIYKAYATRVGGGPMPTELSNSLGETIRQRAWEFGATTGRARRCGWFDAVAGRFSNMVNGFTSAVLTRLDVLDILPTVRICVAYRVGDRTIDTFPGDAVTLSRCEPVYEDMQGWLTDTSHARSYDALPERARAYVKRLEKLIRCPIDIISIGPRREETIIVRQTF
ncbi:MAG: adenylosuccinate synthase [Dehalococcoidia bacterium]|nr:adenylosuccinate synthase [Dehalococcoidia bacterium]